VAFRLTACMFTIGNGFLYWFVTTFNSEDFTNLKYGNASCLVFAQTIILHLMATYSFLVSMVYSKFRIISIFIQFTSEILDLTDLRVHWIWVSAY
jgi:hypothetical protein